MLQYITNTDTSVSIEDQVKKVLEGGCRWIQVRMKEATDEEITKVINTIKPWCEEKEAFLILNDRVELAKQLNVGGVHLGREDMAPTQARAILGPAAVIGVTANTIEEVKALKGRDIDYIGLGPFASTSTKKNLAPILGIEGLSAICQSMKNNMDYIDLNTVAVGGIQLKDVDAIMQTGVNGIAVSGAIAFSNDIEAETRKFIEALNPYYSEEAQ